MNLLKLFNPLPKQLPAQDTPVGILAGHGPLPFRIAQAMQNMGYPAYALCVEAEANDEIKQCVKQAIRVNIDQGETALDFLKQNRIRHIVMAGKIPKQRIYSDGFKPDSLTRDTLEKAGKDKGDDRILKAVAALLKIQGIEVLEPSLFLKEFVAPSGVMTRREPTPRETEDIQFGFKMAKKIGGLDIGQTVVVKDGCVLSVEAIEGTDACIKRGIELGKSDIVICKTARADQNRKFDLPTLGPITLVPFQFGQIRAIAWNSTDTFIAQKNEFIERAKLLGITLISV